MWHAIVEILSALCTLKNPPIGGFLFKHKSNDLVQSVFQSFTWFELWLNRCWDFDCSACLWVTTSCCFALCCCECAKPDQANFAFLFQNFGNCVDERIQACCCSCFCNFYIICDGFDQLLFVHVFLLS